MSNIPNMEIQGKAKLNEIKYICCLHCGQLLRSKLEGEFLYVYSCEECEDE